MSHHQLIESPGQANAKGKHILNYLFISYDQSILILRFLLITVWCLNFYKFLRPQFDVLFANRLSNSPLSFFAYVKHAKALGLWLHQTWGNTSKMGSPNHSLSNLLSSVTLSFWLKNYLLEKASYHFPFQKHTHTYGHRGKKSWLC